MEWALKYWKYNPLIDKPGRRDSYSTPAFNLAGVILERKMGFSFDQLVQIEIAGPAGMSTLRPDYVWSKEPRRAVGYFLNSGVATRDNRDNDVTWKLAAGGYVSTVEDMGKYADAMLNNTILTNGEKQMMWNRQALSNGSTAANRGLAWVVRTGNYGDTNFKVTHGGAQEKARCYLSLFPDRGLAVGVMTNSSTDCSVRGLGEQIESVVLNRLNAGGPPIKKGYQSMIVATESIFPTYRYISRSYKTYAK